MFKKLKEFKNSLKIRKAKNAEGHPLKTFDDMQCIFVHIPKCAGVSINKTLFGHLGGGHKTLNEYKMIFGKKDFNKYFKFTIVRNPWDRLVSAFHFLKKGGMNYADKEWAEKHLSSYENFDSFVKGWLNKDNIMLYHHFKPQYHYISLDNTTIDVDFVGYLENINDDFDHIAEILKINTSLSTSNKSDRGDYLTYYTEETKKIVADVYSQDIELLGYSFDNSNISEIIKNRK